MEDYHTYPEARLAQAVWVYGSPCVLVAGTCLNLMSVGVLLGRRLLRRTVPCVYLLVLAVLDLVVLYTGLLRNWVIAAWDHDLRLDSRVSCKLHTFLTYLSVHLEAWVLVNMSLERVAAVFMPHLSRRLVSRATVAAGVTVTAVLLAALDGHFLWTFDLHDLGKGEPYVVCEYADHASFSAFLDGPWHWVDMSVASLVPFGVMLIANVSISVRLLVAEHFRRNTLNVTTQGAKMTSMTAILLAVTFTFLLLTGPLGIFLSLQNRLYAHASTAEVAHLNLIHAIVSMCNYSNYAINFLLYCISGPRFRREFFAIFQAARVHPHTQTTPGQETANTDPTM